MKIIITILLLLPLLVNGQTKFSQLPTSSPDANTSFIGLKNVSGTYIDYLFTYNNIISAGRDSVYQSITLYNTGGDSLMLAPNSISTGPVGTTFAIGDGNGYFSGVGIQIDPFGGDVQIGYIGTSGITSNYDPSHLTASHRFSPQNKDMTAADSALLSIAVDSINAAHGTAGTYGDATHIPSITTDAKGRVASVTIYTVTGGGSQTLDQVLTTGNTAIGKIAKFQDNRSNNVAIVGYQLTSSSDGGFQSQGVIATGLTQIGISTDTATSYLNGSFLYWQHNSSFGKLLCPALSGATSWIMPGTSGTLALTGTTLASYGITNAPTISSNNRVSAATSAQSSISTITVGAADKSFIVSANINVTTSTTHSFTMTCTYTNESNNSVTLTEAFTQVTGSTLLTAITNITGAGSYEGLPFHIRAKAGSTITWATTGTFTSVTYNAEGIITQY